jgi:hypothetical protein
MTIDDQVAMDFQKGFSKTCETGLSQKWEKNSTLLFP